MRIRSQLGRWRRHFLRGDRDLGVGIGLSLGRLRGRELWREIGHNLGGLGRSDGGRVRLGEWWLRLRQFLQRWSRVGFGRFLWGRLGS